MAREPSYPKDAPVGTPPGEAGGGEAAREARAADRPDKSGDPRRTKHLVAGAAIGIGSAALVAALLYANRSKKNDKSGNG